MYYDIHWYHVFFITFKGKVLLSQRKNPEDKKLLTHLYEERSNSVGKKRYKTGWCNQAFISSTFVYSSFSPEIQFLYCLLGSVTRWGGPMVDTEGKTLGI